MVTDLAGLLVNDSSILKAWVVTVCREAGVERGKGKGRAHLARA